MDSNDDARTLADGAPPSQALGLLVDQQPERHDLVIGFVGAIGTEWRSILPRFEKSLRQFGYETETVHIAGLLDDLEYQPLGCLPSRDSSEYHEKRMDEV